MNHFVGNILQNKFYAHCYVSLSGTGAEPDIFIWGGHWRGQFCNKGSCQLVCVGLSERDLKNFGGATGGGQAKFLGGSSPPLAPPSSAPDQVHA